MAAIVEPHELEATRAWFRKRKPMLKSAKILDRIAKESAFTNRHIARLCLRELMKKGEVVCAWVGDAPCGVVENKVAALPIPSEELAWRSAVDMHAKVIQIERQHFYKLWPAITDLPLEMFGELIEELLDARLRERAETTYLHSAAGRLASSKLFSALPAQPMRDLGILTAEDVSAPPCFLIAGSPNPEAIVLVENVNAFERAFKATRDMPIAWICVYGFGASALETGDRLSMGLNDSVRTISAVRDGTPQPLHLLLRHENILHWGDLDVAGLQIFQKAKKNLPQLQLSALYLPMIHLLENGGGHPYVTTTGKSTQNSNIKSRDSQLTSLYTLCSKRAADQEYVHVTDIIKLSQLSLTNAIK